MPLYAWVARHALGFDLPTLARKIVARSGVYGPALGLHRLRVRARVKNIKKAYMEFFPHARTNNPNNPSNPNT